MNSRSSHRARSLVGALLAFTLGLSTMALARPMNAWENGQWIGDVCKTDSRPCDECVGTKCGAIYSTSPNIDICISNGLLNCP